MQQATSHLKDTVSRAGDIVPNIRSFHRHMRAENLAVTTQRIYLSAAEQLAEFLAEKGMPQDVASIHREHVEEFITRLLDTGAKPATASNRYRAIQAFFKYLDEEGELQQDLIALRMFVVQQGGDDSTEFAVSW